MEIWKDVVGYEGIYKVSNLGRIKSLERLVGNKNGTSIKKEKILFPCITTGGYHYVNLYKHGGKKVKYVPVHRLVSIAFITNPENKPEINHKDGNKLNNKIDNIEWVTKSENHLHKYRVLGHKSTFQTNHPAKGKFGKFNLSSKAILQYNLKLEFIKEWDSAMDVKRDLQICNTHIGSCCKGKLKTAGGFIWKYKKTTN